jgi:hypothetical protein
MSFSPSFPTPNNDGLVLFKEPRALAGLAVKPPAVFLPNEKPGSGSLASSRRIFATGTSAAPTTRRRAGFPTGVRAGGCSTWAT